MDLAKQAIVHMDMDTFFVSCERLVDPSLEGKPVIVGGSRERGVVAACSYETRKYGVRSGMSSKQAARLCPQAIFLKGTSGLYSQYAQQVRAIVQSEVPVVEFASIDEFYCDLTGMDRFHGSLQVAHTVRNRILEETKLPVSFGLSSTKTSAKIITGTAKPNGWRHVPHGQVPAFLAPMDIGKIPGLGAKTAERLQGLNIRVIGDIQRMQPEELERLLGKYGPGLWRKAWGLHAGKVQPYSARKSVGAEQTFAEDIADGTRLKALLVGLAERVGYRLRKDGRLSGCVVLKLRYSTFQTETHQTIIPYTRSDRAILQTAHALFEKHYQRGRAIRLLGIQCSHLMPAGLQLDLFDDQAADDTLHQHMDELKGRYGATAVFRAAGLKGGEEGERLKERDRKSKGTMREERGGTSLDGLD